MSKVFMRAVLALIRSNGKILLTKRDEIDDAAFNGYWQIPGGGIDNEESPEEALHREVQEELGLVVDISATHRTVISVGNERREIQFTTFYCTVRANVQITLNEEASEFGWFTHTEALAMKLTPASKILLDELE